jgi:hypothetical protein
MKKVTIRHPARPADPALDAWVGGSTPEPVPAPEVDPIKPPRPPKPVRLTIDLAPDTHAKFKAACAIHRTNMIGEVTKMIEGWIKRHG